MLGLVRRRTPLSLVRKERNSRRSPLCDVSARGRSAGGMPPTACRTAGRGPSAQQAHQRCQGRGFGAQDLRTQPYRHETRSKRTRLLLWRQPALGA